MIMKMMLINAKQKHTNTTAPFTILFLLLLLLLPSVFFATSASALLSLLPDNHHHNYHIHVHHHHRHVRILLCSSSILDRSGGILYRTSILNKNEWDAICKEVIQSLPLLRPESKFSNTIAHNRLGLSLSSSSSNSPTVKILADPNSGVTKYINRIVKEQSSFSSSSLLLERPEYEYVLSPDIPVEIRSYVRLDAHMNWHVDDVLYSPIPQIEVILTIINTSDCKTMWQQQLIVEQQQQQHRIDHDANRNEPSKATTTTHQCTSIETDPNSILCLRAGVTSHCVTNLHYGKRIIIKCAYIPTIPSSLSSPSSISSGGDNKNTNFSTLTTFIGSSSVLSVVGKRSSQLPQFSKHCDQTATAWNLAKNGKKKTKRLG